MKKLLLTSILALASTTSYGHGSSHPKWKIHHDYYGKPYLKCSNHLISTEEQVSENIHNKEYRFYVNDILDIDALRKLSLSIEGKRCNAIYDYELPHPTFFEIKDSQESLAIKILNESKK